MNAWSIEHAADMAALAEPRSERLTIDPAKADRVHGHLMGEALASAAWSGYGKPGYTYSDRVVSPFVQRALAGKLPAKVLR